MLGLKSLTQILYHEIRGRIRKVPKSAIGHIACLEVACCGTSGGCRQRTAGDVGRYAGSDQDRK